MIIIIVLIVILMLNAILELIVVFGVIRAAVNYKDVHQVVLVLRAMVAVNVSLIKVAFGVIPLV